jgi:hypothetical protein
MLRKNGTKLQKEKKETTAVCEMRDYAYLVIEMGDYLFLWI